MEITEELRRPELAVSTILQRGDTVLLVLRANAPAKNLYAFPGGRVEPGETLEAAAERELLEETGLVGSNLRQFAVYDLPTRDTAGRLQSHFLLTVFVMDDASGGREPIAADDAAAASWFTREEALTLPVPDSVRDCLLRLADV